MINGTAWEPQVSVIRTGKGPRSIPSSPNHFLSPAPLLLSRAGLVQNCPGVGVRGWGWGGQVSANNGKGLLFLLLVFLHGIRVFCFPFVFSIFFVLPSPSSANVIHSLKTRLCTALAASGPTGHTSEATSPVLWHPDLQGLRNALISHHDNPCQGTVRGLFAFSKSRSIPDPFTSGAVGASYPRMEIETGHVLAV